VTVFLRHTSASLILVENADPSARRDLERWFDRLVREDDPDFIHTHEGPDWKLPLLPANQHGRTRISSGCRFFMGI
jgi:thiamine phosphate synthase YjbQ (UPF0047 family)